MAVGPYTNLQSSSSSSAALAGAEKAGRSGNAGYDEAANRTRRERAGQTSGRSDNSACNAHGSTVKARGICQVDGVGADVDVAVGLAQVGGRVDRVELGPAAVVGVVSNVFAQRSSGVFSPPI